MVQRQSFLMFFGSFSDREGNSIRKTEYPISNTEYPSDEVKKRRNHSTVEEN